VNGSVRPVLEALEPGSYLGVDIELGPRVDEVCDVADLAGRYGDDRFDVVVATELVEHVEDWRTAFTNLKRVARPGGLLLVTTRSPGFAVHGYPYDFWRYETADMQTIFADFDLDVVETDPDDPGVFVKARKPPDWTPATLDSLALYSVIERRRTLAPTRARVALFKVRYTAGTKSFELARRMTPKRWRRPLRNFGESLLRRSR